MKTAVVILAIAAGGSGPDPAAERRKSAPDAGTTWAEVAERMERAIERDPTLADDTIEVNVSGLLVTLRGTVDSEPERRAATEIARQAAEPQMMVENDLAVRAPAARGRADKTTRQRLEEDLIRRIAAVAPVSVRVVQVPRLRVIVEGEVASKADRRRVFEVVRQTPGVDEIEDRISVRPRASR